MTASALRGDAPTPDRLGKLMRDVLHGTMEAMDAAMPPAFRSDKMREAADAFTGHLERVAQEFTRGARNVGRAASDPLKQATEAVRAAAEHPVDAARDSMQTGARAAAAGARAAAVGASRLMSATGGVISGVAEGIAEAADRRE